MNTLSYDRTSSWDDQKISNETQYIKVLEYVSQQGFTEPKRFSDHGKSGGTDDRPAFQELIQEIKSSKRKRILLVYRYDRIARNTQIAINFIALCGNHNVIVISVMEPLPDSFGKGSSAQKLFVQTLFIMADFQRSIITENIHVGMAERRKQGKVLSNNAPFGYRWEKGSLVQQPKEAGAVKRIYELYSSNQYGYKRLIKQLNEEGILYKDASFKEHNIFTILSNKAYYGELKGGQLGSYTGEVEPIVSKKLFDDVQRIRKSKQQRSKKKDKRNYTLRQKIVCPYCGRRLTPKQITRKINNDSKQMKRHYYYYCSNYSCRGIFLQAKAIEGAVGNCLRDFCQQDDVYDAVLDEIKQQVVTLQKETQKIEQQQQFTKSELLQQFESGEIDAQMLKAELNDIDSNEKIHQKKVLANQLAADYQKQLKQLLQLKNKQTKSIVFQQINRVIINEQKELKGVYLNGIDKNIIQSK